MLFSCSSSRLLHIRTSGLRHPKFAPSVMSQGKRARSPTQEQVSLREMMPRKERHTNAKRSPGEHSVEGAPASSDGTTSKLRASASESQPASGSGGIGSKQTSTKAFFSAPDRGTWAAAGLNRSLLVGQFGEPAKAALQRSERKTTEGKGAWATFALFDLDWTLIKPKPSGGKTKRFPNPKDDYDFVFLYPNVARKLQEAYEKGHIIVICSNQLQKAPPAPKGRKTSAFQPDSTPKIQIWKKKLTHVVNGLGVPAYVMASLLRDEHRKPHAGMWHYLIDQIWAGPSNGTNGTVDGLDGVPRLGRSKLDVAVPSNSSKGLHSYFVGDLAGRIAHEANGFAADHRDTDLKFALNAGLAFFTPEAYFLNEAPPQQEHVSLRGFDARSAIENSDPSVIQLPDWVENGDASLPKLVIFVGAPGSGKSSYYHRIFEPRGFAHVNQDTLGSRDKCVKEARNLLSAKRSVVVDNTNRDKATRKHYLQIAKDLDIAAYCFHFQLPLEQAWHQNVSRGLSSGGVGVIPVIAFNSYRSSFQPPELSEGFSAPPFEVPWVFVGDDKHKAHYSQWFSTMEEY